MTDEEKVRRIKEILKYLSYREREIIKLRYGLGDGVEYTLEEIGYVFSVTRERIRQIERKAIKRLATLMTTEEAESLFGKDKQ